jgi:hypothetical protein
MVTIKSCHSIPHERFGPLAGNGIQVILIYDSGHV